MKLPNKRNATGDFSVFLILGLLFVTYILLIPQSAIAQSLFDIAVRGTKCNAVSDGSLYLQVSDWQRP